MSRQLFSHRQVSQVNYMRSKSHECVYKSSPYLSTLSQSIQGTFRQKNMDGNGRHEAEKQFRKTQVQCYWLLFNWIQLRSSPLQRNAVYAFKRRTSCPTVDILSLVKRTHCILYVGVSTDWRLAMDGGTKKKNRWLRWTTRFGQMRIKFPRLSDVLVLIASYQVWVAFPFSKPGVKTAFCWLSPFKWHFIAKLAVKGLIKRKFPSLSLRRQLWNGKLIISQHLFLSSTRQPYFWVSRLVLARANK